MRARAYAHVYACTRHTYTRMYTHAHSHTHTHTHLHVYTCRDDELDRVIVPLATGGVVGTIKACVPGVKTCKDALYKVPAWRHHSATPFTPGNSRFLREMRHSSTREHRSQPPPYTHAFPRARFSAPRRQPFPSVLPGIWVNVRSPFIKVDFLSLSLSLLQILAEATDPADWHRGLTRD